ncbi:MAG: mannonate dehydratase [Candidatus Roseilinea sp.]|uniref:mannonate dehydratase n=1 Tax=Candidatus Roseilinea sp. TaxID=2838777 RepID=UPI004049D521
MKFGLGLYGHMLNAENFRFARQAGATHIVAHVVGHFGVLTDAAKDDRLKGFGISRPDGEIWTYEGMRDLRKAINAEGLELEAIENFEPAHWYDVLLDGPRKREQMEHLKRIIRDMGRAGIPIMGYNFSFAGVWGRVKTRAARGGAEMVGFHAPVESPIPKGMIWNMVYDPETFDPEGRHGTIGEITQAQLWERLTEFLREMLPVAEEAGVKLALHPDDPPLPSLRGTARLVYQPYIYDRVLDVYDSPMNTLEFCLGTLSEMSEGDVYEAVDKYSRLGRIAYIHLRNVRGKVPHYDEVFIDEGDMDVIHVLRILHRNRYDGVVIPDHTPAMSCAAPWHAGMAYALGYMRAAVRMMDD